MSARAVFAMFLAVGCADATLLAQGRGRGNPHKGHDVRAQGAAPSDTRVDVRVVFSPRDTVVLREYYSPQRRALPPGLAKKYARTGQLPPGWQKKMQPFPVAVERRLEPLPTGYQRGVFEGHAVIYRPGGVLVDATVIF